MMSDSPTTTTTWLLHAPEFRLSLCCLFVLVQVMTKLQSEATGVKGAIVSALLSASYTHIQARRVATGHSLTHAQAAPSAVQRVVAAATVTLTAPLYALAQKLVFAKVRVASYSMSCCSSIAGVQQQQQQQCQRQWQQQCQRQWQQLRYAQSCCQVSCLHIS